MVINQGNFTPTRYFFCLLLKKLHFLFSTLCVVLRWFPRSVVHHIVMFTRESGLISRSFAQFLFNFFFQRGRRYDRNFWKFQRGVGSYLKFLPCWRYGYFLELHISSKRPFWRTVSRNIVYTFQRVSRCVKSRKVLNTI